MPVLVTDYLGLDTSIFETTGAFNRLLDMDTLLFIDPALLRTTQAPELQESADRVTEHFRTVILLLRQSKTAG